MTFIRPLLAVCMMVTLAAGTAAAATTLSPAASKSVPGGTAGTTSTAPAASGAIKDLTLSTPSPDKNKDIDPKDIPDVLMDEMKQVETDCHNNYFYSNFHDCRCVAVKFLDARIKSDPDTPRSRIYENVASQCPDPVSIAGYVYTSCASFLKATRPDDYVPICKCTANTVATQYTAHPNMNIRYIERLRKGAYHSCGLNGNPAYQAK